MWHSFCTVRGADQPQAPTHGFYGRKPRTSPATAEVRPGHDWRTSCWGIHRFVDNQPRIFSPVRLTDYRIGAINRDNHARDAVYRDNTGMRGVGGGNERPGNHCQEAL